MDDHVTSYLCQLAHEDWKREILERQAARKREMRPSDDPQGWAHAHRLNEIETLKRRLEAEKSQVAS